MGYLEPIPYALPISEADVVNLPSDLSNINSLISTANTLIAALQSAVSTLQSTSLTKANNLSDVASIVTARASLGLGTAATQSSSAFDPAGAAATAQAAAEAASLPLSGGTLSGDLTVSTSPGYGQVNCCSINAGHYYLSVYSYYTLFHFGNSQTIFLDPSGLNLYGNNLNGYDGSGAGGGTWNTDGAIVDFAYTPVKNFAVQNSAGSPGSSVNGGLFYDTDATCFFGFVNGFWKSFANSYTTPIALSNGIISISQASASADGYLSEGDWNTFHNAAAAQAAAFTGSGTYTNFTVLNGLITAAS
jgi:hypothetical protein